MKNIRAYLTIAVVSLMLVVVSAFSMSTVKAMLAQLEEPEVEATPIRFTVLTLKAA